MATMKAQYDQKGSVTVVRAKGKITIGEGDLKLKETISSLLAEDKMQILLDLGQVSFMDSSGIGELVASFTTVKNKGGTLKLLNLTKKIHDLLQVTQLHTVFDVFDDEDKALASYS